MTIQYKGYEWRPVTADDEALCAAWIESDPDHRGRVLPKFFIEPEPGVDAYVVCDGQGPVFFLRLERVLRVHIQFGPSSTLADIQRNRVALVDGFEWLIKKLTGSGFRQMIFDSTSNFLRKFCGKRFGFSSSPNELVRQLAAPKPSGAPENPAPPVQTQA